MKYSVVLRGALSVLVVVFLASVAFIAYDELWWRLSVSSNVVAILCIAGALIVATVSVYIIWTVPIGSAGKTHSSSRDEEPR